MALNYYSYKTKQFTCRKCKWKGLGKETTQGETFDSGFEIHCPKCEKRLPGLILYPTTDEALKKGSPSDKIGATLTQSFQSRWQASLLKDITQLPSLHYDSMTFVLREIEEEDGKFIVITHHDKIIWKEVLTYEYFDRFIEIGKLFKQKYGKRMVDLVPDVDGYSLYGDKLHSLWWVDDFRKELRKPGRFPKSIRDKADEMFKEKNKGNGKKQIVNKTGPVNADSNSRKTKIKKLAISEKKEIDNAIFDWLITYRGGKKETFRGLADQAHNHALSKSKKFSVEKLDSKEATKLYYRENLVAAVDYLIGLRHELFDKVLNISMKGDLSEIDESFDEGDTYEFQLKHLKGSSDINVNKLIDLIEEIERTADSLANINKIEDSELKNER